MKEGEVVCEFETLWPDKVCKKVFELENLKISVCDLAVEENDVQELYHVDSMEDIKKYEARPVETGKVLFYGSSTFTRCSFIYCEL